MQNLRLNQHADFGALYDAVQRRQTEEEWKKTSMDGRITREKFVLYCNMHFPAVAFECDGKQFGWVFFDGKAAHIEVLPEYHGRWGILWPATLEWVFQQKDPIQVAIDIDNEKCHRFMTHNNWPRIGQDEKTITYEMSSRTLSRFQRRLRKSRDLAA